MCDDEQEGNEDGNYRADEPNFLNRLLISSGCLHPSTLRNVRRLAGEIGSMISSERFCSVFLLMQGELLGEKAVKLPHELCVIIAALASLPPPWLACGKCATALLAVVQQRPFVDKASLSWIYDPRSHCLVTSRGVCAPVTRGIGEERIQTTQARKQRGQRARAGTLWLTCKADHVETMPSGSLVVSQTQRGCAGRIDTIVVLACGEDGLRRVGVFRNETSVLRQLQWYRTIVGSERHDELHVCAHCLIMHVRPCARAFRRWVRLTGAPHRASAFSTIGVRF